MKKLLILLVIVGGVYQHFFRSPDKFDALSQTGADGGGIEILTNQGGTWFNVNDLAEPGHITVVEFYTESCGACRRLRGHYNKLLPLRPDLVVKRVKMPDRWSVQWARRQFHLNIGATPFIHIYDASGELIAADDGQGGDGRDTIYKLMNAELKKERERKNQRG